MTQPVKRIAIFGAGGGGLHCKLCICRCGLGAFHLCQGVSSGLIGLFGACALAGLRRMARR